MSTLYYKYPRTLHLPFSKSVTNDDKIIDDISIFNNIDIVLTEKMDGENTNIYPNHVHARSIDSKNHPSRSWVKNFASTFQHMIPDGWRVCGENMFTTHSIKYNSLSSYFLGFAIYNEHNNCLSWKTTLSWFKIFGIDSVPVIYHGKLNGLLDELTEHIINNPDIYEGYVIRQADKFTYNEHMLAKYVRLNHVQTDEHWMYKIPMEKNGLL